MLSNIFGKQAIRISDERDNREFFNLRQFRANFKRDADLQREHQKVQMSMSRYSQSRHNETEKESSHFVHDRYQPLNRSRRSPEGSRRNDSFISTSQIRIPNFLKAEERSLQSKRYSLPRNNRFEKGSLGSKLKDTSTLSKFSSKGGYESSIDSIKFDGVNAKRRPVSIRKETEVPLQLQQNLEKAKESFAMRESMFESKNTGPSYKDGFEKQVLKTLESRYDNDSSELIHRIQSLKDRLEIKMDSPQKPAKEHSPLERFVSKKTTFKDVEVTRPASVTRRLTRLETRLPFEEVKALKETFEAIDTFDLNQLPNK